VGNVVVNVAVFAVMLINRPRLHWQGVVVNVAAFAMMHMNMNFKFETIQ
jgi:hypothetical protein